MPEDTETHQILRFEKILLILAVFIVIVVCLVAYQTIYVSFKSSKFQTNDIPHIEERIKSLEGKVCSVNTNVGGIQEQITNLSDKIEAFLERSSVDWESFRKQIREDVREEIRDQMKSPNQNQPEK